MLETRCGSSPRIQVVLSAALLAFGLAGAGRAQDPFGAGDASAGPKVGPNLRVNSPQQLPPNDWPTRDTPSLSVSRDGQRLLGVFEDFQGFCGPPNNKPCPAPTPPGVTGFAYSTNAGSSWTDGGTLPPIGNATAIGHPWTDRSGGNFRGDSSEVYYAISRMRINFASVGIGIWRGHFSGSHFTWDDGQIINSSTPGDQYSRAAFAASRDDSKDAYVVLSNVLKLCGIPSFGFGQIEVWRTHDGGDTWQGPTIVSPDTAESSDPDDPLCGVLGPLQVAPAISVGPHGEVYVVWQKGPRLLDLVGGTSPKSSIGFARSLDGGATFSAPQTLVTINANYQNTPVGHGKSRQNDQPRIAVAVKGPYKGRVYATFYQPVAEVQSPVSQQSATSAEAFLTYSDTQGQSWSTPHRVATQPVPPTGVKRFWPTVSVRDNGDVDVVYLESRETQATANPTDIECSMQTGVKRRIGPLSSLVDTYWVQSRDGGATFGGTQRVSKVTSNWCTSFYKITNGVFSNYGDYIATASAGNKTYVLWPDGRFGVTDLFFAEVRGEATP